MIERVLGAGSMGVVYRAHDLALGRPVAIKMLPETFSPALRERLLRETEACARLQHPAVANISNPAKPARKALLPVTGQPLGVGTFPQLTRSRSDPMEHQENACWRTPPRWRL